MVQKEININLFEQMFQQQFLTVSYVISKLFTGSSSKVALEQWNEKNYKNQCYMLL